MDIYICTPRCIGELIYTSVGKFQGNVFQMVHGCSDKIITASSDGKIYSLNNTYIGFDGTDGVLATSQTGSFVSSINDLFYNEGMANPAYHVGFLGGTFVIKNPCAYAVNGKLDEVMSLDSGSPFTTHKIDMVGLLEVDPLLDGDLEPLEEQVRTGVMPDVLGDATAIGAIKTMNTTVINTAVQTALSSGGVKLDTESMIQHTC